MIINKKSGFYGYTIDTTGDLSDINGSTDKCMVVVMYNQQVTDIDVEISNGEEDWAILTGDGSTIPVKNPQIIFTNKSNCVIQFTLTEKYPSNSPCFLVYRSDSAYITTKERLVPRPFEPNMLSGFFGFTSDNGKDNYENGLTDKIQMTIPFPVQTNLVDLTISEDDAHWGIRVGDGSIIPVKSPQVLFTNQDNGIVEFTLTQPYPSNSPAILVYRSADAYIKISGRDEEIENIPVTNIRNIPSKIFYNDPINLSQAIIEPPNATNQFIKWDLLSGPADINDNTLIATGTGPVKIRASIIDGDDVTYSKIFNIEATKDIVTMKNILPDKLEIFTDDTSEILTVNCESQNNFPIKYQWYKNNVLIGEATNSSYTIPNTEPGNYNYKCQYYTQYSDKSFTNVCNVLIENKVDNITFKNPPSVLRLGDEYTFIVEPNTIDKNKIVWSVSNSSISTITQQGLLKVFGLGDTTVTAVYNGRGYSRSISHSVNVKEYLSVTDVKNLPTEVEINKDLILSCTIEPSEAAGREIQWILLDRGSTEAILSGNSLRAKKEGIIRMRCVVKKGYSLHSDYIKDFNIKSVQEFIPVQSINVIEPDYIEANKEMKFRISINPHNATNQIIGYEIQSDTGITANVSQNSEGFIFNFSKEGNIKLIFKISKGKNKTEDFIWEKNILINKKFIPVYDVINFTSIIENVQTPQQLIGDILPADATNKNMKFKIKKAYSKFNAKIIDNKLSIDYNFEWWKINQNPKPDLSDQWIKNYTDPIEIEITIKNGLAIGTDFKKTVLIGYKYPDKGDQFISVKDVKFLIDDSNLDRIDTPIPFEIFQIFPFNATNKNLKIKNVISIDDVEKNSGIYFAGSKQSFIENIGDIVQQYDGTDYEMKTGQYYYLMIFEMVRAEIEIEIVNGHILPGKTEPQSYTKKFELTCRPKFNRTLSYHDQINKTTLYYNPDTQRVEYDYLFLTHGKLSDTILKYSDRSLNDFTEATYQNFQISEINKPSGETYNIMSKSINNKAIELNKNDVGKKFNSIIKVENGINERIVKDSKTIIEPHDVEYKIEVTVSNDPNIEIYKNPKPKVEIGTEIIPGIPPKTIPKITITDHNGKVTVLKGAAAQKKLDEGLTEYDPAIDEWLMRLKVKNISKDVKVKWFSEISLLSNRYDGNYQITIDGKTFAKKDITEVEFWATNTNLTTPTSLRLFGFNFNSLTKISSIPKTITGDYCLESFLEGCTSFNQAINIPESAMKGKRALYRFMKDCTSFNSNITFVGDVAEGEAILGKFLMNCTNFNKEINLPAETVKGNYAHIRFMQNCTSFNSNITFASNNIGHGIFKNFMTNCTSFNKSISLPTFDSTKQIPLCSFMMNCFSMQSIVSINFELDKDDYNSLMFGSFERNKPCINNGIKFNGVGSQKFVEHMKDRLTGSFPLRKFIKI